MAYTTQKLPDGNFEISILTENFGDITRIVTPEQWTDMLIREKNEGVAISTQIRNMK